MTSTDKKNRGQLMIMTVLILGVVMMSTTLIAGYLTSLKIRQSVGARGSAEAFFAADSGLEVALMKCLKQNPPDCNNFDSPPGMFSNQAYFSATFVRDGVGNIIEIRSLGTSNQISRALRLKVAP